MNETTTTPAPSPLLGAGWSDPLEDEVRGRVRAFIEEILVEELSTALGRRRYERAADAGRGWRNGHRLPPEVPCDLARRAAHPVDAVPERPRDRVVVLRRHEKESVRIIFEPLDFARQT